MFRDLMTTVIAMWFSLCQVTDSLCVTWRRWDRPYRHSSTRAAAVRPIRVTTLVGGHRRTAARDYGHRLATSGEPQLGKEPRQMATQINVLGASPDAASLLVVLMAILAMLGIVANVAIA